MVVVYSCARTFLLVLVVVISAFTSADTNVVVSNTTVPVFQGLSKVELCAIDFDGSREVLSQITVIPESAPSQNNIAVKMYPRVLCYAVTYSAQHQTRVRAVAETWGQRCDQLLFFSNMSDTIVVASGTPGEQRYEVVQLDIIADHAHLWLRTRAALNYLHQRFRHDYDWFYKTDDDTYVVMENLRKYVKRPEILQAFNREPIQLGHRFNLPEEALKHKVHNETLFALWRSRWSYVVYNSGGAGYVMNRLFLDKIVESLPELTCLPEESSGTMPEDAGVSFCMMWHGVYPWDTRDHLGRERWHAYNPHLLTEKLEDPRFWYSKYHEHVGGVRNRFERVAPDSVAFHYVKPDLMHHIERTLYLCRTGDDLAAFNQKFGLAVTDKILATESLK